MSSALSLNTQPTGYDPLSAIFIALADPTRRTMLKALARGEQTLTELAAPFSISMPAVTKHLRILERAGLIARGRDAQRKPCSLRVQPLNEAADWIAQYRAEWEARLDRLDAFVIALQQQEIAQKKTSSLRNTRKSPSSSKSPSTKKGARK